jgi:ribonucleoside-diphosphate reductase alpha chain
MMGAVQPFISGAISKTINMPAEVTVDEVAEAYVTAWKLGLKAVAIYRDGSKRTQPLNTGKSAEKSADAAAAVSAADEFRPYRRKLPDERKSITHKFDIAGHEGYISGLMDSFATAISYALQYGVPLQFLVDKFAHMRFEPSGFTKNPRIPYAKSIVDYLFRWLASKFLDEQARHDVGIIAPAAHEEGAGDPTRLSVMKQQPAIVGDIGEGKDTSMRQAFINQADAPPCPDCGCIMVRNGACYKCMNCGATSGCS